MRKTTAGIVVIVVLLLLVSGGLLFLVGGGQSDDSDDTGGTDPTEPTDDIIPDEPPEKPEEPTKGSLVFYVLLDGKGVTGATCKATGTETQSKTTSGGYAYMELKFGAYSVKVTYGDRVFTKNNIYVGPSGAHVEVLWASDLKPTDPENPTENPGRIKVYAYLDNIPIQAIVTILSGSTQVATGTTSNSYDLEVGSYTVKARFESSQTYTGSRTVQVKSGEVTSVVFSWTSGGGLGDLNPLSGGTTGSLFTLGIAAFIALLLISPSTVTRHLR